MRNNTKHLTLIIALCLIPFNFIEARDYYVSPNGSDHNPGTLKHPLKTFSAVTKKLKPGDTCIIREGIYSEVLRPQSSGEAKKPITFTNYKNEKVVLTGADTITGWAKEENGIYSAPMPWSLPEGNQVFANGTMLSEAVWPASGDEHLFKPIRAKATKGTPTTLTCPEIPGGKDSWKEAQLWCAGGAAWICWTASVTGYDDTTKTLSFKLEKWKNKWYFPKKGNLFSLRGIRQALKAPGQWLYDNNKKRLLLIPPKGTPIESIHIEAKRRKNVIDLKGRSHIIISGLDFRSGGLHSNKESSHITLKNLRGRYLSHSYTRNMSFETGVIISGDHCLVLNCDFGYASGSVLHVRGKNNRVINSYLHHGCYSGLFSSGTVFLSGTRTLFSHNTVRHAGRDLINTSHLMESLVQYNDVSDAGWLTKDLGMFYGHNTDFAGTRFCYNLVHDNHAEHCAMGIYFDHLSHNAILHNNIIWNVGMDAIRFNNPSYCNLIFKNTFWNTGPLRTFDHTKRNDLFACRFSQNIFNAKTNLPKHVNLSNNLVSRTPPLRNPAKGDFRLTDNIREKVGALEPGQAIFKAGCDFDNPPKPLPVYTTKRFPWMNGIKNACFEYSSLEYWQKKRAQTAKLTKGNGWGNENGRKALHQTGTSKQELRLGPENDEIIQVVKNLSPNTPYTFSVWLRVSSSEEKVLATVQGHGGAAKTTSSSSVEWVRKSISFTTGPQSTRAIISLIKSSGGKGYAWCDNAVLPLTPAN
ncbi:MAG: right-handed parallel beta-helix repeat-containing protein [Planctomycetes bacterium]|nr:right-handed parallel beta-helix repeat-containing protein [Planctomycetota bacterium]